MTEFHARMAAAKVVALWEQEGRNNCPPQTSHLWRWETMSPLLDEAVAVTDMHNAERRVLVLANPDVGTHAASNLSVNLQVLMPGERARPHRHTMHALRFVLEGTGAVTTVEGKPCQMHPGDMILTPGWTWHEHANEGNERAVWVDALDVPVQRYLENAVFEPGPAHDIVALPPDAAFPPGLAPDTPAVAKTYSPLFRYPWEATARALEAVPVAPDGSRRLRYTNPVTGGAVMATLDCYLLGLARGADTAPYRTNSNAVCVVMEGEGRTRIGDETVEWGPKDIFNLPHGQWISHRASRATVRLFQITDREIFQRLDLLREERRH